MQKYVSHVLLLSLLCHAGVVQATTLKIKKLPKNHCNSNMLASENGWYGNVKQVTKVVQEYEGTFNHSTTVMTYDTKGRITSLMTAQNDAKPRDKTVFTYNAQGCLSKEASYFIGQKQSYYYKEYTYNDLDLKTKERIYKDGVLVKESAVSYDKQGRIVAENLYNGMITYKYSYEKNKQIKTRYDGDGNYLFKIIMTFNDMGNEVRTERYDINNELIEVSEKQYNTDHQFTYIKRVYPKLKTEETIFTYDKQGYPLAIMNKSTEDKDFKTIQKNRDKQGNALQFETYYGGKLSSKTHLTFEYYE